MKIIIDALKIMIQVLLIVWFVSVTLFVLVPSFTVLSGVGIPGAADLPKMPDPPVPPTAEELKSSAASVTTSQQPPGKIPGSATDPLVPVTVRDARVDVYTQQVTAYTQQLAAYKSQIETGKTRQVAAYRAVVTDTLVSLLSTALTAFLGYVFVASGAELVNKYVATKRGENVESLKLF